MRKRYPTAVVIDLKAFLDYQQERPFFASFGRALHINEFVNTLLSVNQHSNYETYVHCLMDEKFSNNPEALNVINMEVFDFNVEGFALDLDRYISNKVPQFIDTSDFILDRWLNNSTVILKYDDTTHQLRHSRSDGFRDFAFFRNRSPY